MRGIHLGSCHGQGLEGQRTAPVVAVAQAGVGCAVDFKEMNSLKM